ncbi:hypothetical protein [Azospirillum sp.]|uniref:hypothetical protein n=1 Tax=Azospirillum sp. TaxID=34012 RepID=UPI002D59F612|nr:hypothetical protein [Azospirillum sp.]HYF88966.1 hypothetical protein [Azospirillum sp.]
MAGIIHRKPGLILPGSPEWQDPRLCDLFGGGMMAGAGPTCELESAPAQRQFFLRGTGGATGTQPATDDMGNALTWAGVAYRYAPDFRWSNYNASVVFAAGSGVVNYVRTTSNVQMSSPQGHFSIGGWYKFVQSGSQAYNNIMGLGGGLSAGCPLLSIGPNLQLQQWGTATPAVGITAAGNVPYNTWVYLGAGRNGLTGFCAVTINGSVVASGTPTWSAITAAPFYIFGNSTNTALDFNFLANDVRFWSDPRYAGGFTAPSAPPC